MIKVRCHTNLDSHQMESWPRELSCKPAIGESMRAHSGKRLTIVDICHSHDDVGPYLYIELYHNRPANTGPR